MAHSLGRDWHCAQAEQVVTGLDPIVLALTNRRAQLGLTYQDVTNRGGPVPASVHAWEHGHKAPTLTSLRRWCAALGYELPAPQPPP